MLPRLLLLAGALAVGWACAEPPEKELHRAQGAIDAARAAGAEQYAPTEFQAATTALSLAHEAVDARDYRLALSHALDAIDSAQAAARKAAGQPAIIRSAAERALTDLVAVMERADGRLRETRNVRAAAGAAGALKTQLSQAERAVQEARSALDREDYLGARDALAGVPEALDAALNELDRVLAAPRRRR